MIRLEMTTGGGVNRVKCSGSSNKLSLSTALATELIFISITVTVKLLFYTYTWLQTVLCGEVPLATALRSKALVVRIFLSCPLCPSIIMLGHDS